MARNAFSTGVRGWGLRPFLMLLEGLHGEPGDGETAGLMVPRMNVSETATAMEASRAAIPRMIKEVTSPSPRSASCLLARHHDARWCDDALSRQQM